MDCSLCRDVLRPDDRLVVEFPHSVVLLGAWQYYRGYCVVVAREHVREPFHLPEPARRAFFDEVCRVGQSLERAFTPHKLNIEMLGNVVPHLHCHLFPRSADDPAKLAPVWLAIAEGERDPTLRRRLEGERGDSIERIRVALREVGA